MKWIMFDEQDRRSPAPHFCLESLENQQVCLKDFHEDCSLVLYISRKEGCTGCVEMLESFAASRAEYQEQDAKILAVLSASQGNLLNEKDLSRLPFPVLSDPDGKVRRLYSDLMDASLVSLGEDMIFVLDAYSAPYAAWIGSYNPGLPPSGLPETGVESVDLSSLHYDIMKWLEYIGIQCPE